VNVERGEGSGKQKNRVDLIHRPVQTVDIGREGTGAVKNLNDRAIEGKDIYSRDAAVGRNKNRGVTLPARLKKGSSESVSDLHAGTG